MHSRNVSRELTHQITARYPRWQPQLRSIRCSRKGERYINQVLKKPLEIESIMDISPYTGTFIDITGIDITGIDVTGAYWLLI